MGFCDRFINRFFIVFRSNGALPLNNIVLKAFSKNNGVQVDWSTTNEIQLDKFEVEKSTNGTNFSKIGTEIAKNGIVNSYGLYDAVPVKGANYYRIKIINQNNSSQYSKTILLNLGDVKNEVTIYPNPVKGTSLSLQLNNLSNGNYQVELFNTNGQLVHAQQFMHNGSSSIQIIDWKGKKLANGNYIVSITSATGIRINRSVFIEE